MEFSLKQLSVDQKVEPYDICRPATQGSEQGDTATIQKYGTNQYIKMVDDSI